MPHIHLQTTAGLTERSRAQELLACLVETLSGCETIDSASVKAYWTELEMFAVGRGAPVGIVHCQVSILAGRPLDLRQTIARALYDKISNYFDAEISQGVVKVTLELREMDAGTYIK
ncbi:MAG: hypothetical protein HND42_05225 [Armatimonadetes bacterium]|nr:hypothetical protein [Armatimonadota bacterium]NOG92627.1 hypothetical protein [Armatimonadota bacterium]